MTLKEIVRKNRKRRSWLIWANMERFNRLAERVGEGITPGRA